MASMIAPHHAMGNMHGPEPPTGPNNTQTAQPEPDHPQHKRVYQACIPCRRRKVKCDLGSVDNPSDPPCVRCRRESKECYFSATRRKRRVPGEREGSADELEFDDDYLVRNGRKRVHGSDSGSEPPPGFHSQAIGVPQTVARPTSSWAGSHSPPLVPGPLTPGGHIGRTQPLRRPQHSSPETSSRGEKSTDDSNIHVENPEAQNVMRREVYGPHDALDLLYKAATNSPGHKRIRSEVHLQHYQPKSELTSSTLQNPNSRSQSFQSPHMGPPDVRKDIKRSDSQALPIDGVDGIRNMQDASYKDALKAWARFRFVRAGWFTPAEAIAYIDYYYTYLSPLTPISPPTFRNPATHPTLLTEEPILTVTLLTIASRYRAMPGPGGNCRSQAIHEQLWTYLRGMVERCLWGQEAFGGGFIGTGALEGDQTSSTAPWRGLRKGSLRTLGTVESLMILTEWHPRALHFPPAEATDELMLPSYESADPMHENYSTDEDSDHKLPGGVGGKRIDDWLEPAWRSDRMCWMLLSNAMGLSYELGVFDPMEEQLANGGDIARPEYEDESYRLRAARIKKLLLIYITQLAGRLGWTNMVPGHIQDVAKMTHFRRETTDGNTPGTSTTVSMPFQYIPDLELDDQIIHCWAGITNAMRIGNERLFKSRKHTTRIIQTGEYIELLKDFQPMLNNWSKQFEGFRMPPYIRHILIIEYEYVRIYVNSLSLQAVVERCTSNAGNIQGTATAGNGNGLSPQTQNYYGKLPLTRLGGFSPEDQQYVKEVVDGSRNLLRTVVEGLLPDNYLKHAPVRTYFRIISGAMFLLKTFALGASKHEIEISIGLMDKAVDALRTCVVDDVHLGTRFADLLETLTSRLRNRFMHAPPGPANSSARQSPPTRPGDEQNGKIGNRELRQGWDMNTPGYQDQNPHVDLNGGISATAFDLGQTAFYANNNAYNDPTGLYELDQTFGGTGDWSNPSEMWYLPPGPAFFQNSDQQITQTAEGVNVGGLDLLDYMAMEQYPDIL